MAGLYIMYPAARRFGAQRQQTLQPIYLSNLGLMLADTRPSFRDLELRQIVCLRAEFPAVVIACKLPEGMQQVPPNKISKANRTHCFALLQELLVEVVHVTTDGAPGGESTAADPLDMGGGWGACRSAPSAPHLYTSLLRTASIRQDRVAPKPCGPHVCRDARGTACPPDMCKVAHASWYMVAGERCSPPFVKMSDLVP